MENVARKTPMEMAKEKYDAALAGANGALSKNPVDTIAYGKFIAELNDAEKEYATLAGNAMYDEYATKNNPIVEIIKAYSFEVIGHREKINPDTKRVESVDPIVKEKQIDLLKFCTRARLDDHWSIVASKVNQLMCLRAAKALGADVNDIAKSYFLKEAVRKIELGGTPTSNTQVCKLLQTVIDEMIPNETEDGKAIYKVNNHDVAYLDDLYGRKSNKARLTVRTSNDAFFRRILVDIAYRLVTNGKYGVDGYKTKPSKN